MPRALIAYFSQTGSTAKVAKAIARGLENAGYEPDLQRIDRDAPPHPRRYEIFGVGAPVHYYRLPFNVSDYIRDLPDLRGIPVFSFILQGTYRFDAGNSLRHGLAGKGGREVGYFHCYGASHYLGHLKEGYLFSADHPTAKELTRAEAFGRQVANNCVSGGYEAPPDDPPPPAIYRLERVLLSRWLIENLYSRLFRVDPERCTACGECIEACPTGNVQPDGSGRPIWGRDCLFCLSCEMNCPEDAVSSFISRPATRWLIRPFLKYHMRRWSRDSSLQYVRVLHRSGAIERLNE
jgi:flavodoxin/Pyruvate/2-oxoacid:ferredoxin oxidoreductase delta subunit